MTRKLIVPEPTSTKTEEPTKTDDNQIEQPAIMTPHRNKIITSFEELANLKARSRIPIDIHLANNPNNSTNHHSICSIGSNLINEVLFRSGQGQNSTSIDNKQVMSPQKETSASNNSIRLRANMPAVSTSINFSSLMMSNRSDIGEASSPSGGRKSQPSTNTPPAALQQPQTVKYFSFMTTNKLFSNYTSQAKSQTTPPSTTSPKQFEASPEIPCTPNKKDDDGVSSNLSSSSNSCGGDSGCGCSLARSSILSQFDFNPAAETVETASTNSGSCFSEVASSGIGSSSTGMAEKSDDMNDEIENDDEDNKIRVKMLCEKIYSAAKLNKITMFSPVPTPAPESRPESTVDQSKRADKILTVLFDYETPNNNKYGFGVKQGEQVKVIRDYDETYYLVAVVSTGRIGFIPKDYTVDLKEVRKRVKLQQQEPCQGKFFQSVNGHGQNAKLTKL